MDQLLERTEVASVGVFPEMDEWSASTRYRAMQFVPHLERRFARVRVSLPGDTIVRHPGRIGKTRYFATHAMRYVDRARRLPAELAAVDAIIVQRGFYPLGPSRIARELSAFPGRVVFDLDDAVFRLSPNLATKGYLARWLYGPQQALALLHRADAVVVSTPTLAEMLPDGSPAPVIMPTVPDPGDYQLKVHTDGAIPTIGWAGTVGGLSYLDPLGPVLRRLEQRGVANFEVVSSSPWNGPGRFHKWKLSDEKSLFQRFDIGIMPLPRSDYTRAKAGFKLLQYMAAGLPVVASPLGINQELVERSQGGILAESPSEWEEALEKLATDRALRERLGRAGRSFVVRYSDIDGKAATFAKLLTGGSPAV